MTVALDDILRRFAMAPAAPESDREIALALANGELTPDLAGILRQAYGLEFQRIDLFAFDEARDHPAWGAIRHQFPGGVLCGWNRASLLYFVDVEDTLHQGAGALIAVDKIYIEPSAAAYVAPDLATFLQLAADGENDLAGDSILAKDVARLRDLLARHTDRIDTRPGVDAQTIHAIAAEKDIRLASTHVAMLEIANGLRFIRSGLELLPVEALSATGTERIYLAGLDPKSGFDLAVTAPGPYRPSDLLLQLTSGTDPASAPSYGRLLPALINWIESDQDGAP